MFGQESMVIHTRDTQSDSINSIITIFITNQEGRLREDGMSYAICIRTHRTYICIHVCVSVRVYIHILMYMSVCMYIYTRVYRYNLHLLVIYNSHILSFTLRFTKFSASSEEKI